jgi:SAM-dependent methyltransferase
MIEIINPDKIKEEKSIITALKEFGINHSTRSPRLGWNYILDHVWLTKELSNYINPNTSEYKILDIGCGKSNYHNFIEDTLNINIIGIDRSEGYCHQNKMQNVDIMKDFLEIDEIEPGTIDIILWLSSIEHNKIEKIKKLYQKSMILLKPGGMFLATFAVSEKTHWFEAAQQTNMDIVTAKDIFEDNDVNGHLGPITEKYRKNVLFLRSKYRRRFYGKFGRYQANDPKYIVGGVRKIKQIDVE